METWKNWLSSFVSNACMIALVYLHYKTDSVYAENCICFWFWFVSIMAILCVICGVKRRQRSTLYKAFILISCCIPIIYMVSIGWTVTASVSVVGLMFSFYLIGKKKKSNPIPADCKPVEESVDSGYEDESFSYVPIKPHEDLIWSAGNKSTVYRKVPKNPVGSTGDD